MTVPTGVQVVVPGHWSDDVHSMVHVAPSAHLSEPQFFVSLHQTVTAPPMAAHSQSSPKFAGGDGRFVGFGAEGAFGVELLPELPLPVAMQSVCPPASVPHDSSTRHDISFSESPLPQ